MLKWPGLIHVKHVMGHMVRRDSSAMKYDRVETVFSLALFRWLKLLTNERREEIKVSRENPYVEL